VPGSAPFEVLDAEPLRDPILIAGYGGWSDAGEAASTAVRYLFDSLSAPLYARIDTEDFLDFTVVRPQVRIQDGARRIVWPDHEFRAARLGGPSDLLLALGDEPHLRWKSYARAFVSIAQQAGVRRAVLVGAYFADVIYSQPTHLTLHSTDPAWNERFGVRAVRYEGPTGILSALADALGSAGIPYALIWAQIPHYVAAQPNPRGALALLQRVEELIDVRFDLNRLGDLAAEFDTAVSELISNDPQLSAYVRELKRRAFSQ
jgi:predicted ATP-grasp superfamily ATP-dependent carboligase